MKNFTSVDDVESVPELVQEALQFKKNPLAASQKGKHKTMAMLFFNPSLRTRMSTQRAAQNLGMSTMVMNVDKDGWKLEFEDGVIMDGDKAEHVKEAAGVISQYCEIIGVRSFPSLTNREEDYNELVIKQFLKYSQVPLVSLESSTLHPLQSLADLMTIEANRPKHRPKVVLTWAPHPKALPQAVPNSFAEWMNRADVDFVITHPEGYELHERFAGKAKIEYNQDKALQDADFVYVKNWSSYRQYGQILTKDPLWTINEAKIRQTNQAKIMHCLPVRRNVVIADQVLDSAQSVILEQANNRTYAAQAVLSRLLDV